MDYVLHVIVLIEIYSILAVALNIALGQAGLLSMAQAAFFGIGGYTTSIIALRLTDSLGVTLVCSALSTTAFAVVLGVLASRTRGDYFAIVTLAFQTVLFNIVNNWTAVTGGPMGLPGIPSPSLLGFRIASRGMFLVLATVCLGVVFWIGNAISSAPLGRALRAIREDEIFSQSRGLNVLALRTLAFTFSGLCAGVAGSLYASYFTFVDPTSFSSSESILVISMVVIGGAGSVAGSVVGASLLVVLPEMLRFVGLPGSVAANLRQIVYGLLLVLLMLWRPRGLVGRYGFGR